MTYRPDTLIEKATKLTANAIASSKIKQADDKQEWTMGKKTTKAEKRKWVAVGYFPHLIQGLDELKEQMSNYIKENR